MTNSTEYTSTKNENNHPNLFFKKDLIKNKHNSNHKTQQTTLKGEIIQEYTYYVLGFVPADVVRLKNDVWFSKLNNTQIALAEKYIESKNFLVIKS